MSVVLALQKKRQNYTNKITYAREQIKKNEAAYESLNAFKSIVSKSQEDFHAINTQKNNVLSQLDGVKKNSITTKKYCNGMQKIFSGTGSKVIGLVYKVLLSSISVKLRGYVDSVNNYDSKISYYEKQIEAIDRQIEESRRAEEEMKLIMGGGQ